MADFPLPLAPLSTPFLFPRLAISLLLAYLGRLVLLFQPLLASFASIVERLNQPFALSTPVPTLFLPVSALSASNTLGRQPLDSRIRVAIIADCGAKKSLVFCMVKCRQNA